MKELVEMLSYCRPAWSDTEEEFIAKYIDPLGAISDDIGNRIIEVGNKPRVMWSSHTDTVHKAPDKVPVYITGNLARVAPWSPVTCLGADCTTGVWLMIQMIRANVPGLYVFHRAEETGMVGSEHLAFKSPDLFTGIEACIAFDRYGTNSIITHQMRERGCSDAFVDSLAKQLPGYRADPDGSYTDSYAYFGLIPECTNISVGYYYQHTRREMQNLSFAEQLKEWLLAFDESKLVIEREPQDTYLDYYNKGGFGTYDPSLSSYRLRDLVRQYPDEVVDFLESQGFTAHDIDDYIWEAYRMKKVTYT